MFPFIKSLCSMIPKRHCITKMPTCCAVIGCSNRQNRNKDKKYYVLPGVRDNRGRPAPTSIARRKMWVAALHRSDLTESKINNARICSDHFITGKPSALDAPTHPDFIPSLKMGYENGKTSIDSIGARYAQRCKKNKESLDEAANTNSETLQDTGEIIKRNTFNNILEEVLMETACEDLRNNDNEKACGTYKIKVEVLT